VARSELDGHTLLMVTVSYVINPAIYTKLAYDPLTDLTGVAIVGSSPLLLTVHPSLPVYSVKNMSALARARPCGLDYGSASAGIIPHLAAEGYNALLKTEIET